MSDKLIAQLRTLLPIWWMHLVTWLTSAGWLPESLRDEAAGAGGAVTTLVAFVASWAFYRLGLWLQPKLPHWLGAFLFGPARQPVYP